MHDLLTEPLMGVRTRDGERRLSLPELLAELSAGTVEGYTGLRAHQAAPWHVFLVQLAASIQSRRPTEALPTDAAYWRDGLLDLAHGQASAWQLIVEDVEQPAFLQHPWKSWAAEAKDYGVKQARGSAIYDAKANTPDELDVLVTSKNHDVKMARVDQNEIEAWLYALLTLQATTGYNGSGNYGVVRMNSGSGSRIFVAWAPSRHTSERFQHEVQMLKAMRAATIQSHGYAQRGVVLTWLTPWDRCDHQYYLDKLEPWFIEAPRAVRLVRLASGAILALGATREVRQIGPKSLENGDVGDPWIPINTGDKKKGRSALTLSADGFTPELLTRLLFEQDFELTPLQKPQPGSQTSWFIASCLVRGQGTTEGYHHLELPIPARARQALLTAPQRDRLAQLAQKLLSDAKDVQKAFDAALAVLCEGGSEKADVKRVGNWLSGARQVFSRRWKDRFFPTLWRGAEEDSETVRSDWQQQLVNLAQELLEEATERMPLPANRSWRAITRAQGALRSALRKRHLPLPTYTTLAEPEETVV